MTEGDYKKLKKFLLDQADKTEITTYEICEKSNNHNYTYTILNLSACMEDGVIWFGDLEDEILNRERCIFKGILMESSELRISKCQLTFILNKGKISIKVI